MVIKLGLYLPMVGVVFGIDGGLCCYCVGVGVAEVKEGK